MATVKSNVPVTLGLITFPVALVSATKKPESLNTVCNQNHDPVRTRQDLYCPECGSKDRSTFVKGKQVDKDTLVVIDEQALADATVVPDEVKNAITLTCHPAVQLGATLPGEKAYFLKPGKGAEQGYPLLAELVRSKPDVAFVCEFAVRTVPSFYRLQAFEDTLALVELARPDTVAERPAAIATTVDPKMLELAEQFVSQLSDDYDPEVYRDRRTELIATLIDGGEVTTAAGSPAASPADLMARLQAAVGSAA